MGEYRRRRHRHGSGERHGEGAGLPRLRERSPFLRSLGSSPGRRALMIVLGILLAAGVAWWATLPEPAEVPEESQ